MRHDVFESGVDRSLNDSWIELSSGVGTKLIDRLLMTERSAVYAMRGHRVIGICYRDHPCDQWNIFSL
jgi:hypothetical protein